LEELQRRPTPPLLFHMIRRAKYSSELKRFHRLMETDVSLESYWNEINRRGDATRSTVEALVYQLRTHGVRVIGESSCQTRLDALSDAQIFDVLERLHRMRRALSRHH
jgi:hypothetical protein